MTVNPKSILLSYGDDHANDDNNNAKKLKIQNIRAPPQKNENAMGNANIKQEMREQNLFLCFSYCLFLLLTNRCIFFSINVLF